MGFDREEAGKHKCGVLIKQERENVQLIHCSKITVSEEHWEGKEVLCSCLHSVRDLVCFAFPSGRRAAMRLQVRVKKTRSHGCL